MKKEKIIAIALLMAIFTCFGAQAKFSIGPKVGINVDKMDVSGIDWSESNRCGFTGGVTTEFTVPMIGIGFDLSLMYSRLSVANADASMLYDTRATEATAFRTKGADFFEIPLHLKYKLELPAVSQIVAPYVFTGPSVAFKLGGGDSYFKTKSTQWGWDLGVGVQLVNHLQIGAGYTFGINKLASWTVGNYNGVNVTDNVKVRNNYWTITAAWLF